MIRHLRTAFSAGVFALLLASGATLLAAPIQLVTNGEFESPTISSDYSSQSSIPGWFKDSDSFELWKQNFSGSPVNGSDGLPTGQHLELTGSTVNVVNWQSVAIPTNVTTADFSFDWWRRSSDSDNVAWEVHGSRSGVIASGNETSVSSAAWNQVNLSNLAVQPGEVVSLRFRSGNSGHIDQVSFQGQTGEVERVTLLSEKFNATPPTATGASPRWFDSTGGGFEIYNAAGASARGMSRHYGPAPVGLLGGIEVNDSTSQVTLTAELLMPSTTVLTDGELSFWAGWRRPELGGPAPTVSIFNVTDSRDVLVPTEIDFSSTASEWFYNEFDIALTEADLGDTLQLRFFGGGFDSGSGLQLTDVLFTAGVVPEPGTFVLAACGLLGLCGYLRRKRR